jgi:hypothetical protein
MNAVDIASDDPGSAHPAHRRLQAVAPALSGLVCHTPEPTPPADDDEDDEEQDDRGSSGGGNIDPDDDEGDFDDDDDEDETLWTGCHRGPAPGDCRFRRSRASGIQCPLWSDTGLRFAGTTSIRMTADGYC